MAHALVALGGGDGADVCGPCDDAESDGPDFDDFERYRRMKPLESENASLREAIRSMRPLEQENATLRADVTDLQEQCSLLDEQNQRIRQQHAELLEPGSEHSND
eukprot:4408352-Prymnesium_polylepis.1